MAALLVAASFMTYNKIKDKRAAKKEAKRKGYETRYNELEREHSQTQERQGRVQMQQTGSSHEGTEHNSPLTGAAAVAAVGTQRQQQGQEVYADRRRSSDSDRASTHSRDDPSSWVDDVLREREKQGGRIR